MPNHIHNVIIFDNPKHLLKVVEKFSAEGRGGEDDYILDFDKIIPMPKSLDIESGSATDTSLLAYSIVANPTPEELVKVMNHVSSAIVNRLRAAIIKSGMQPYDWVCKANVEHIFSIDLDLGRVAYNNVLKYGTPTWYDWRVNHWGTKWNSYAGGVATDWLDRPCICFDTAWAPPRRIYEALSRKLRGSFTVYWCDEGDDCAHIDYYDHGQCTSEDIEEDCVELVDGFYESTGLRAQIYDVMPSSEDRADWLKFVEEERK